MQKTVLYGIGICLLSLLMYGGKVEARSSDCRPVLWRNTDFDINGTSNTGFIDKKNFFHLANKFVKAPFHPVKKLSSAGKTNIHDPVLVSSRRAFLDPGQAAFLALAYKAYRDVRYLEKVRNILVSWAHINHPTGNPIDETRLEGFIWAYDLVACDLSAEDKATIESWFYKMRQMKSAWRLGPITRRNNHATHQLKMMLLLDMILHRKGDVQHDLDKIHAHLKNNIDIQTGKTIDYQERDALYYHNYDLQPWLEISLVSHCCQKEIIPAFEFLSHRIVSHDIGGEFLNSRIKIDLLRGQNNFSYAIPGGKFKVYRASETIVTYYTIYHEMPPIELWKIVNDSRHSAWMNFVMYRQIFWGN